MFRNKQVFIIIIYLTANRVSPGGRGTTIRQQTTNTHQYTNSTHYYNKTNRQYNKFNKTQHAQYTIEDTLPNINTIGNYSKYKQPQQIQIIKMS
jgi:hypothetical protein